MKTSGHLIFYISENEDFELWRVLTQITPEDRAAFIKNALKKALLEESQAKPSNANPFGKMDRGLGDPTMSELALEELGYAAVSAALERDNMSAASFSLKEDDFNFSHLEELLKPSAHEPQSSLPGLDFLLNNVIGEESDEEVIDFIRRMREEMEDDQNL